MRRALLRRLGLPLTRTLAGRRLRGETWARWRGQALAEFALVLPVLLMLALGAADLGTLGLERYVALNGAESVAEMAAEGVLEDDPLMSEEVARSCADGAWTLEYTSPLVTASLTCSHVSLSSLMPSSFTVTATAVERGGSADALAP